MPTMPGRDRLLVSMQAAVHRNGAGLVLDLARNAPFLRRRRPDRAWSVVVGGVGGAQDPSGAAEVGGAKE
jgi:hypothetical protein